MKIEFGEHKGKELEQLPCSYLRWIRDKLDPNPTLVVPPERREAHKSHRILIKYEARRILQERGRNGVKVLDPKFDEKRRARGR